MGLVFSVITVFVEIYETTQEEAQLVSLKKAYSADEKQLHVLNERFSALHKKKVNNILNLLKNLGDMVTASQAVGLPAKLFGFNFNDGQVGLGGLTSSLITCY